MTTQAIELASALRRPKGIAAVDGPSPAVPAALESATLVEAYGAHRGAAYTLAYRVLGDRPAAEDAAQDASLKPWTGAAQFDPSRGSMRGLLLTIARHTSIADIRRRATPRHVGARTDARRSARFSRMGTD